MTRRKYETEDDRERARKVAAIFAQAMGMRAIEISSEISPVDFSLQHAEKDDIVGFCEIKTHKKISADLYPNKMIALLKWVGIWKYVQATGLPCYIVFAFPDDNSRIKYVKATMDMERPRIAWGGRRAGTHEKAARDEGDRETMVYFDSEGTKELHWRNP